MSMPSMPELLVILAIVVLLFGAKKIPDLAKGIGKGIKDFKHAVKEDEVADAAQSTKELDKQASSGSVEQSSSEIKKENV